MPESQWEIASDLSDRLVELKEWLGEKPTDFTARFGRGSKQWFQWRKGKQLPPRRVLEAAAIENDWPLEIFQEAGRRPKEVVSRLGGRRKGVAVVGGRRYETPLGVPIREAIDRLDLSTLPPEDVKAFAGLELADLERRGQPMSWKRVQWWIEQAFAAGQRAAGNGQVRGQREAGG